MNKSIFIAIIVTVVLAVWVLSGTLFNSKTPASNAETDSPQETVFSVLVREITVSDYTRALTIRGRTEAIRTVLLKSEAEGPVIETPVEKGERVQQGTLICQIAPNERIANLEEARALMEQRRLEYDAAQELSAKGHRSATQVAQAKAQFEAAQARMKMMQVALENTSIRAPFDGLVDDRLADIGDFLQVGGSCARIMQEDPFLVVGEVSERDVNSLIPGSTATVFIAPDFQREGHIRYIASSAAERTRTFRVEVVVPNPDYRLRDGRTAEIRVPVETIRAHSLSPSFLVLDTDGRLGIRTVADNNRVIFYPVHIVSESGNRLWVTGLPDTVRVIVTGQEFVTAGQTVDPVTEQEDADI